MPENLETFRRQIEEDIKLIKKDWLYNDKNLEKSEYAFNYWVLSKIFNIDDEIIPEQITEYNDRAIDCWFHSPERKEICLIQNKYYGNETTIDRGTIADFLKTPLTVLNRGNYSKSEELQNIFNQHKDDKEYSINLCFFITNENISDDIKSLFEDFNKNQQDNTNKATIKAYLYTIKDMYEKYYGKMLSSNPNFSCDIETPNKGTFASVRDQYGITDLNAESYYIITPVTEIYKLFKEAENAKYSLFEENIRGFLGRNKINKGIIKTLEDENERKNFLFYNNGITLICSSISNSQQNGKRYLTIKNPQIINGCQTTNSICAVLNRLSIERQNDYLQVYVMVKALVVEKNDDTSREFYADVVKYTNRQNAIKDKAFASNSDIFKRLQEEFQKRGSLLLISPSDKNTFSSKLNNRQLSADKLMSDINRLVSPLEINIEDKKDLFIDLEKLLQVFTAFFKGAGFAYKNKPDLLNKDSSIYNDVSCKMQDYTTFDNLIKLYYLYYKSEKKRKTSEDKRTPIPYYVLGFLGSFIEKEKNLDNIEKLLNKVFSDKYFTEIFDCLSLLTKKYMRKCNDQNIDYNNMIKKHIDEHLLGKAKEDMSDEDKYKRIFAYLKTE